ncbi:MAG: FtsX-like permease family protein, partial [Bacteroidota bacterium]
MSANQPPKWAIKFLRWYCKEAYLDEIEGDLFELYAVRAAVSKRSANLFFIWNVFRSFRLINLKETQLNNWTMNLLSNYTKVYLRRFKKETIHFLVNIVGLALGFSILFFILMFVYDEQNMDAFHSKGDRIYRVIERSQEEDGVHEYLSTPGPLADALKQEFPGIEAVAHVSCTGSQVISKGEQRIVDRDWAFVTREIFDIWDVELIDGDPGKPFQGDAGLILTENAAQRLFGRTDVVGERVDDSRFGGIEVLAIMKEMPRNSSYQFKELYVVNYDSWGDGWKRFATGWNYRFTTTWVLLKEGSRPEDVYSEKEDFLTKYYNEENRANHDFFLQPISEVHLGSKGIEQGGMYPELAIEGSSHSFVSIILLMGFLVLFIASLNYINLSSVQALKRTLEASMRKINGASNKQLVGQLFFETLLTVLIAYFMSLVIVAVLFPYFQHIANKDFSVSLLFSEDFVFYHLTSVLIVSLVSALLPALYYSKLKRSLLILKNAFSGKGDLLRKVLVSVQYALSIFLIVGAMVIYRQLNFVQSKDLGFEKSNMMTLDINSGALRSNFKSVIEEIKKHSGVTHAAASSRVPGEWKNIPSVGIAKTQTDEPITVSHYAIDHHWIATYQMGLIAGKNFSGVDKNDSLSVLVNQQLVNAFEMENPIGQTLWVNGSIKMKIIGIVEDFHFQSLYEPIAPVALTSWNSNIFHLDYFTIKFEGDPKAVVEHVQLANDTFDPETPAEINFLDDKWARFYQAEESRATITLIASIVSIIISAFGLFGLINFTVERKTKEIGIRKVMGASLKDIARLILKDYLILLIVSLLVATPISWWLLRDWLSGFAYRIDLNANLYLIAFFLITLISFSTVLIRILKITRSTPVDSLKY